MFTLKIKNCQRTKRPDLPVTYAQEGTGGQVETTEGALRHLRPLAGVLTPAPVLPPQSVGTRPSVECHEPRTSAPARDEREKVEICTLLGVSCLNLP